LSILKEYEDDKKHIHVLSYGGGTQSTALLLMALKGEINGVIPDYIIFSDTGWEPEIVYKWIEKVNKYIKKNFNREIHFTSFGNIYHDTLNKEGSGKTVASMPLFVLNEGNKKSMLHRQCTIQYKIAPVKKKIRTLLGYRPKQRVREIVHMWKGISTDEIRRAKPIPDHWIEAEHPLIDVVDMDRQACIEYVEKEGLGTPPRSACIGCPYRDNRSWYDIKINHPEEFQTAVNIDEVIRHSLPYGSAFLHVDRIPLTEVDFRSKLDDPNQFDNECEGMCGV